MATTPLRLPGIADELFEGCPAATLIVDGDVRVLRVNAAARALLRRVGHVGALLERPGGEVLRCVHASGAGGAGEQEACRRCVIRRSVAQAMANGAVRRAAACVEQTGAPGPSRLRLLVSASAVHDQGRTFAAVTLEEGDRAPCDEDGGATRLHDALLAATSHGVVHLDERGTILSVNPAAERILGAARAELVGATWAGLASRLGRDDGSPLPAEETPPSRAMRTGRVERGALRLLVPREGAVRWIDVIAAPISSGEGAAPFQVCAVLEDVTERRHLEEELRHQRDFTQSVADCTTEAIFVVDDAGRVRFANRAAHGLFELAPEDLRGRRLHEVIHHQHHEDGRPYPASDCPLRAAYLAGPGFRDRDEVFLRGDGSAVHVRCSAAPVEVAGLRVGAVLVARDVTTLRSAAQAARLSESFLAFALETAGIGAWDLDLVDHTAHRSRQHGRIFGYEEPLPQWTYEAFLEHVIPGDRGSVDRVVRRAVAAGSGWSFECRIRRRDGEIRWIWVASHPFDGAPRPRRMAGVVQDITEHKRTEAALRESEERLRSVLEKSLDCIYRLDLRTNRYTYVSPAAERVVGVARETLLSLDGEAALALIHPADRERVRAALARLEETGEAELEYRQVTSGGGYKWISNHVALTRDEAGRPLYLSGTIRDVDERKRADDQLRYHASLMDSMGDAVISTDREFRVRTWNRAAEITYGYAAREALGRRVEELLGTELPAPGSEALARRLWERGAVRAEMLTVDRRGGRHEVQANVVALRDSTGAVSGALGVLRDVTESKRAEEELRASRERIRELAARQESVREEEKARIARELHDEMGQLLTALRLDVEALEEGLGAGPLNGRGAALLDRAVDASELVAQTVNALQRVVSALRPAALDRLGLCPALREECRRFEERTGVRCLAVVPEQPDSLGPELDTALFRIAQEALTNVARHARASKASVVIRVGEGEVVLRVEDDGQGLDLAAIASSRSLGIAGMRERAERLGGDLSVAPGERGGTVVVARIPRDRRGAPPPAGR